MTKDRGWASAEGETGPAGVLGKDTLWRWEAPHGPDVYESGFAVGPTLAGETLIAGGMNGVLYAFPIRLD